MTEYFLKRTFLNEWRLIHHYAYDIIINHTLVRQAPGVLFVLYHLITLQVWLLSYIKIQMVLIKHRCPSCRPIVRCDNILEKQILTKKLLLLLHFAIIYLGVVKFVVIFEIFNFN